MAKTFYTERDIEDMANRGVTTLAVNDNVVLTDLAREMALKRGVRLVDIAVKATEARPGAQIVEREFGLFEVHSHSQAEVLEAGRVVLDRLCLKIEDRVRPEIASIQIITNVDPYQAQLLNRFRRGSILVPGETLLVLECAPAAYINYAFNEAEKGATIKLVHISSVGRFGRLWLSGTEAEVLTARNAAVKALEELEGKPGK